LSQGSASNEEICGINERFWDCGPAIEFTCENFEKKLNSPKYCVAGCFCDQGFVRKSPGECVRREECPPRECGANEFFSMCGPHTICTRSCDHLHIVHCPPSCTAGCFCNNGFVRDPETWQCITVDQCPSDCGPNKTYNDCGSACPDTCENYGELRTCPPVCVPGCHCNRGYVRNSVSQCILYEDCPSIYKI